MISSLSEGCIGQDKTQSERCQVDQMGYIRVSLIRCSSAHDSTQKQLNAHLSEWESSMEIVQR